MPTTKEPPPPPPANATALLQDLFERGRLFENDETGKPLITHTWERGNGNFVVVVGDNATGKSLFRRLVCQLTREVGYEPIHISMQGRTTEHFSRAFIYGSEDWESTGQISAHTVTLGIKTCQDRTNKHVIFWDEPNLGLSDSWSAGMGVAFRDFAMKLPEHTVAAFVVTHSKALLKQLVPAKPHYVAFGVNAPASLEEWLDHDPPPRDIEQLGKESHTLFKRISKVLKT